MGYCVVSVYTVNENVYHGAHRIRRPVIGQLCLILPSSGSSFPTTHLLCLVNDVGAVSVPWWDGSNLVLQMACEGLLVQ